MIKKQRPPRDAAVPGSSAEAAAHEEEVEIELSMLGGACSACACWALRKFYDQVSIDWCIKAAKALEFPPVLLALGLGVIFGPRILRM